MSDHAQKRNYNTSLKALKRLTDSEIESLRKKNTEELLEAAELELESLECMRDNPDAMKKRGIKAENLPWMIDNMKNAVSRFKASLKRYEKG